MYLLDNGNVEYPQNIPQRSQGDSLSHVMQKYKVVGSVIGLTRSHRSNVNSADSELKIY